MREDQKTVLLRTLFSVLIFVEFPCIPALGIGTGYVTAAGAGGLDDKNRRMTFRAGFGYGPVPHGIVALRILIAGIEQLALARTFFHQHAFAAFGAGDARGEGRGIVAFGISGTAQEAAAGT